MRVSLRLVTAAVLAIALAGGAGACGGTGGQGSTPVAPSPAPGNDSQPGVVTITITSNAGAQSFSPNPASIAQGQMVVWRNADSITHHVVLNDGSIDTGDLAPGASSAPMRWTEPAANYHCTIHPTMVGSVNTATDPPPDCSGQYC